MPLALKCHLQFPSKGVTSIEAKASRDAAGKLALCYIVTGTIDELRFPGAVAPARRDDLWQHTCFEAFLRISTDLPYFEFNLSPSMEWAAYRFESWRSGRSSPALPPPKIETRLNGSSFELYAALDLDGLGKLALAPLWELGLSAILEDRSGHRSYWALAHPEGEPNFHHSDCFALELAAAEHS